MTDHQFVRYRPEYLPQVAQLLTEWRAWSDLEENAAHFSWLYEQNPYAGDPLFYLLVAEGRVIAMRGFYGARWEVSGTGETFDAPCATMFVTDAAFRGQGLAGHLMKGALADIAARGHPFVFSGGAVPIPYMSQLRNNWRLVASYHTIRRKRPTATRKLRRAVGDRLPFLRKLWRATRPQVPAADRNPFASLDALDSPSIDGARLSVASQADAPAMAALASAASEPGLFRHLRDEAYFRWRFLSPRFRYRFVYLHDTDLHGTDLHGTDLHGTDLHGTDLHGTGLAAFAVLHHERSDPAQVTIVDWEARDPAMLKRLFGAIVEFGHFDSLSAWSAALPAEMVGFLEKLGFEGFDESQGVEGYRPGLLVKSLDAGAEDSEWEVSGRCLHDPANWSLRPVFSDQF